MKATIRKELSEKTADKDPFRQFARWFSEAARTVTTEVNAMCLATADAKGRPSARMVLLKEVDPSGFVFFTSYESRKGREISDNPHVAATFFWKELERQVRITGRVRKVTIARSEAYFRSRPQESQVSAAVSPQSQVIPDRNFLEKRKNELLKSVGKNGEIPMPGNWGGFIIIPETMEFWQGREHRLHDRILYKKGRKGWTLSRLAP